MNCDRCQKVFGDNETCHLKNWLEQKKASNPYSQPSAVESIIIQSPEARECENFEIKEILEKAKIPL